MRREDIEKEVEKTLRALDDHERVEANPYFMTRLMQRIENEKKIEDSPRFRWTRIWQPALLATLVVVNAYTFYHFFGSNATNDTGLSVLMKEYNYTSSGQNLDYISFHMKD